MLVGAPFDKQRTVIAGKLTSSYGVKGWLKLHSFTEPPENIFKYGQWLLVGSDGNITNQAFEADDFRRHGAGLVVHIKGIDTRDQASLLCPRMVAIEMGMLPPLPDGNYYWNQLEGLQVLSCYGRNVDDPVLLGQIRNLLETGANDVMVVVPCDGSIDDRERLLPYVDAFVVNVDLQSGNMLVDWDPEF